jgi:transketolase
MPSCELFEKQPQAYRDSVLPPDVTARVSVEQATVVGWERYVGLKGKAIGMRSFGASAPLKELQKKFGFEPDSVAATVREVLGR